MNQQKRIFITGTDTDVGKTLVTTSLVEKIQQTGKSVVAVKPIAAGCQRRQGEYKNSDALAMQSAMNHHLDYSTINPIALKLAIAPHLAAENESIKLTVKELQMRSDLSQFQSEYLLVEGAGGWLVPLNGTETLADFAVAESLDILLVVGMKLGCINHALLTVQSIRASGLNLIGWIANSNGPEMPYLKQNIQTLMQSINAPLIAEIPYIESDNASQIASGYVNITALN